jgi:hypothetical protein
MGNFNQRQRARFFLLPIIVVSLATINVSGQAQTWTPTSAPMADWAALAASGDATKLVAAANGGPGLSGQGLLLPGLIYTSTNAGFLWQLTSAPSNAWVGVASSCDGSWLATIPLYGQVYTSTNSGATWNVASNSPTEIWGQIASSADGLTLAAAVPGALYEPGGIYVSTNAGDTWNQTGAPTTEDWTSLAVSADASKMLAGTIDGGVFYSTNSGAAWSEANLSEGIWGGVAISSNGTTFVAALNQYSYPSAGAFIYVSTDSGTTWHQSGAPLENWEAVAASGNGRTLIAEDGAGEIYTSSDTGDNWTKNNAPALPWISVVTSEDGLLWLAAADDGGIYAVQSPFGYATNEDNTLTITDYDGTNIDIAIPTNINGMLVTVIGENAFSGLYSVTNFTLGTNVTTIEDGAFADCSSLTNIIIPSSVTSIWESAFVECSALESISVDSQNLFYSSRGGVLFNKSQTTLVECPGAVGPDYTIPDGVTNLGEFSFDYCTLLTSVTIPPSLTSISDYAFAGAGLTSIAIPASVTNLGASPFSCPSLMAINVAINNPFYVSVSGVLFDESLETLIEFPEGVTGSYVIPPTVSQIGQSAFDDCNVSNVTIPDSVNYIEYAAFNQCEELTSVTIPNSVTAVETAAFDSCWQLTNVIIGNSVKSIGTSAFEGCFRLTSIAIPDSVNCIGEACFYGCTGLNYATIGQGLAQIGGNAFYHCTNLTAIYFDGNAPVAGLTAFGLDTATAYYLPGTSGWGSTFAGLSTRMFNPTGSLQVTLAPTNAIDLGAQWRLNGGDYKNSGDTITDLPAGTYLVSFKAVFGWAPPPDRFVTVTSDAAAIIGGLYFPVPPSANGLILITNGLGSIQHRRWPDHLATGSNYTVVAVPGLGHRFQNWVGGANSNISVLSSSASYKFAMQPGMLLQANFESNIFSAAQGLYCGLFAPENAARQQSGSGSFTFSVTATGMLSGKLQFGSRVVRLAGKFDADGSAAITNKLPGNAKLATVLQLDAANHSVAGTVSSQGFTAQLNGFQNTFDAAHPATAYKGVYTLTIPGAPYNTLGPPGTSFGSVKVSASGVITFAGSLADGTAVSQSSIVSQNGAWAFYLPLYGGQGSIWSWNYFLPDGSINSFYNTSWINVGYAHGNTAYSYGFTNQQATADGFPYNPTARPLLNLTDGDVVLNGGLPLLFASTNEFTLGLNDTFTFTNAVEDLNKMSLAINPSTGIVSGSFADPGGTASRVKFYGIAAQGQTNAQGYFLYGFQGGSVQIAPH